MSAGLSKATSVSPKASAHSAAAAATPAANIPASSPPSTTTSTSAANTITTTAPTTTTNNNNNNKLAPSQQSTRVKLTQTNSSSLAQPSLQQQHQPAPAPTAQTSSRRHSSSLAAAAPTLRTPGHRPSIVTTSTNPTLTAPSTGPLNYSSPTSHPAQGHAGSTRSSGRRSLGESLLRIFSCFSISRDSHQSHHHAQRFAYSSSSPASGNGANASTANAVTSSQGPIRTPPTRQTHQHPSPSQTASRAQTSAKRSHSISKKRLATATTSSNTNTAASKPSTKSTSAAAAATTSLRPPEKSHTRSKSAASSRSTASSASTSSSSSTSSSASTSAAQTPLHPDESYEAEIPPRHASPALPSVSTASPHGSIQPPTTSGRSSLEHTRNLLHRARDKLSEKFSDDHTPDSTGESSSSSGTATTTSSSTAATTTTTVGAAAVAAASAAVTSSAATTAAAAAAAAAASSASSSTPTSHLQPTSTTSSTISSSSTDSQNQYEYEDYPQVQYNPDEKDDGSYYPYEGMVNEEGYLLSTLGPEAALLKPATPEMSGRKCLVLDLDETLVHSSFKYLRRADFVIPVEIDLQYHNVYVIKRPGVDEFMRRVGQLYEIVVFTASVSRYGDPLLDQLDIHNVVHHRLFRESCFNHQGNYIKDLSVLGRPLKDTIIIDNSPTSYAFHPQHAIPVSSWFSDAHDNELLDMIPFLEDLASDKVADVSLSLDVNYDDDMIEEDEEVQAEGARHLVHMQFEEERYEEEQRQQEEEAAAALQQEQLQIPQVDEPSDDGPPIVIPRISGS
ncbi:uncharacterized protein SAPINGB_P002726 [Magnusiomyces paraingens]|uniref:FCP1 homology domain-containing protein n=1 Tax=Magnusiomyces paraingens TaxID=2606893 RepID=A0A5E8BFF4_9ASCO|nr:uncharacterized protein SAPINGB_P002726 [Saprochaete ingens]VVT50364.1 unnamed protein product [Saprochaete ingens]